MHSEVTDSFNFNDLKISIHTNIRGLNSVALRMRSGSGALANRNGSDTNGAGNVWNRGHESKGAKLTIDRFFVIWLMMGAKEHMTSWTVHCRSSNAIGNCAMAFVRRVHGKDLEKFIETIRAI